MDNVIKKELAERDGTARPRLEKLRPDTPALKQPQQLRQLVTAGEKEALRHTGIDILGDVPWGTHFCLFYYTKEDLIDILVPYFKAGLDNNEFCTWVTSEPLNAEDAKKALKRAVRNLDAYIKKGQIEILDYSDWYTKSGAFEADSVLQGWVQKHDRAIKDGFDGLRLTGNTFWLERKDWAKFTDYEAVVNNVIGKYKMLTVCTYSLDRCGASEILDVEHNHQFALIKWRDDWKILESSDRKKAEEEIENLAKFPSENPYPVLRITRDGTILYANDASAPVLQTWGCKKGQRIPDPCYKRVQEAIRSGKVSTFEFECNDGRIFLVVLAPFVEADYVNAYGIDITERKKAEEALKATNQQLRASEQQLRAANQQLQASEQQLRAANQQLQANEQQLKATNQQLRASEQQLRAANQQLRASEQQLLAYQGQLKSLASQLTLTEEHQRHQIATELHATIGQNLVISKLQLDALRASAPSGGDLARTLEQVTNLLDETVEQTRTLVSDLSSPILYELGFETAVADWLTEQIKQKHNIKTEFEDDRQPKPLDNDIRVLLFRNVRELLVNVVKHAHAGKVKVSISKSGSQIEVSVEDDGWGVDPREITGRGTKKGGFGLFSIRERLEQLGGHFEIKSAPGYGCKVTMTAPLKEEKH